MRCDLHETWTNGKDVEILCPDSKSENYLVFKNKTHWIRGWSRYWLLNNGWRRIK